MPEDRDSRYFGFVQSHDSRPRRRLFDVLTAQGLPGEPGVTFLTDGGDSVRGLARLMSPCAEHILDWFHVAMRLTVLGQYAKGLAQHSPKEAGAPRPGWSGSSGSSGTATSARRCSAPAGWPRMSPPWTAPIPA